MLSKIILGLKDLRVGDIITSKDSFLFKRAAERLELMGKINAFFSSEKYTKYVEERAYYKFAFELMKYCKIRYSGKGEPEDTFIPLTKVYDVMGLLGVDLAKPPQCPFDKEV